MEDEIKISLTHDEALVLFELLSRFKDSDKLNIEHQSEERALWNFHCLLEEILIEPIKGDYKVALQSARERLKDEEV